MMIQEGTPVKDSQQYYTAYENRYRAAYEAGIPLWGHAPDDEILVSVLTEWAEKNDLAGKRVIEFACGEGSSGIILSKLGCIYHGVDIAPSALEKAKAALADYPNASVSLLDMVCEITGETYDAALDVMGFHMLVTDSDRRAYLHNVYTSLKPGAPALFFRESYRRDMEEITVSSFTEWLRISDSDYTTPEKREMRGREVWVPLLPARARSEKGYRKEFADAGFIVEQFEEMEINRQISFSASIYLRKEK